MKKTTLVLGASLKPIRYSYEAILKLQSFKHPVKAIGLREGVVGNVEIISFKNTIEKPYIFHKKIHTITLYLNPKRQQDYYNFIIEIAPERVIFNPGTENPELYILLEKNNIKIEVACTLVLLATGQY